MKRARDLRERVRIKNYYPQPSQQLLSFVVVVEALKALLEYKNITMWWQGLYLRPCMLSSYFMSRNF